MGVFDRVQGLVSGVSATLQRVALKGTTLDVASVTAPLSVSTVPTVTTITPDLSVSSYVRITLTTNAAQTIAAPVNGVAGQYLRIEFRNTSGGAAGAATFNAVYKLQGGAWAQPATGQNRKVMFYFDGTNWTEVNRSAADVAN